MTALAFVVAAGLGSALRHAVNLRGLGWRGTTLVNVVGSLFLGLFVGFDPGPSALTVIGIGFFGSLTTFSMFALEVVESNRRDRLTIVVITVTVGVAAAALGHALG